MVAPYRLYGADLSPYSVKILQLLRFKGIEHQWLPRSQARQAQSKMAMKYRAESRWKPMRCCKH